MTNVIEDELDKNKEKKGSIKVSGKLPTYPSPKLTLTLNSYFGQNDGLGEGWVGSFPERQTKSNREKSKDSFSEEKSSILKIKAAVYLKF